MLKPCLSARFLVNLDAMEFGNVRVSSAGGFRYITERDFQL